MKKKSLLLILLMALIAPWAAKAQTVVNCYPPTQEYATGYTDGSTKTSGEMHCISNGGVRGWMMFDVSSIPDGALINSIKLHFYCTSNSNSYVKLTSAGQLNPTTASASELNTAIGNTTPNYYTGTYMSGFSSTGWKAFTLSSSAVNALMSSGLTADYFTLGFYEYETYSGYSLYASGYDDETNKPYIEVSYSTEPSITLDPTSVTVFTGFTKNLTATTANVTGTPTITYSSDDESVATVSGSGTSATVTAVAPGTATITATMTYNATDYTATCDITVEDPSYCEPAFNSSSGSYDLYITNFTTDAGINNSTGFSTNGYGDYYNTNVATIEAGETLNFSVSGDTYYGSGYAIWVDWNKDYEFSSDERVAATSATITTSWSGSFDIASTTPAGDYRMRVMMVYYTSSPSDPCNSSTSNYGEAEDYKLTVIAYNPYQKPVNLHLTNLEATTATLAWEAPNTDVQSYKYQYREEGGTWNALTSTTALSAPLADLTDNTTYEFQVQAIYAGNNESNFVSKTFTTECNPYSINPTAYQYGFEDVSDMDCWTLTNVTNGGVGSNSWANTNLGYEPARTGNNFWVFLYVDYPDTNPDYQTLISPRLTDLPANGVHVEFYYVKDLDGSGEETFRVGYSTTDKNLSSFTWGTEITNASTEYQRFSANYPQETKYVAVQHTSDDQYYLFLDDFTFEGAADCLEPSDVLADNITTTSADITWTAGGEETAWDIYVTDDSTIVPDDGTTPTYANVSTKPYPLSLTPATTYYVYVRAACKGTETSAWSTPGVFHTECEGMDLPYGPYGFEDGALSVCWNVINTNTSYNSVSVSESNPNTGTHSLDFYRGSYNGDLVAVLPEVGAYDLSDYQFEFSVMGGYAGYEITIGIMTDPDDFTTFVAQGDVITTTTSYAEHKVRFNEYTGTGKYVAISVVRPTSISYTHVYVDDIAINPIPSCIEPTGLAVASPTAHGATFGWTAGGSETEWHLYFGKDNTAPADDIVLGKVTVANSNPFTMTTGLDAETDYYVWVRANCGSTDGYSMWVGPETFTTGIACHVPTGLAYSEVTNHTAKLSWTGTSDSYNVRYRTAAYVIGETTDFSNDLPTGWTNGSGALNTTEGTATISSGSYWSIGTNCGVFDKHAYFNMYNSKNYWLITPSITLGTNDSFSFDVAYTKYNTSGSNVDPVTGGPHKLYVLISTDNKAHWTVLREWNNTTSSYVLDNIPKTGQTVNIDLSAYTGQDVYMAILGVSSGTSYDNNIHIDNISVGTPVAAGEWTNKTADASPYTATGLLAKTKYEAQVQGNCGGEGLSQWSASVFFTTDIACPAPTALAASNPTSSSFDLQWTNGGAANWVLAYKKTTDASFTEIDLDESDVTIEGNLRTYTLGGLDAETDYIVKVQDNCEASYAGDGQSEWTAEVNYSTIAACSAMNPVVSNITHYNATVNFEGESATGFTVNYRTAEGINGTTESFDGSSAPTGWEVKTGLLSDIMGGSELTASAFPNWVFTTDNGVFNNHTKLNIYGNKCKSWLISPEIEVGTGYSLNFDLALTDYNGSTPAIHTGTCDDDRFLVLVFVDNAWEILREWNNNGSTYVYNDISYSDTGENVNLSLSAYNNKTVKIAFYGESTTSGNGDNNLHIDNVTIGVTVPAGDWQTEATATTTANLSGLTAGTKYDLKVVPNCDETLESATVQFSTLAGDMKYFLTAGEWGTAANWMDEEIPTINDNATIRANVTISSGYVANAKNITLVGSPTPTLTIADGGQLFHSNAVTATMQKTIAGTTTWGLGGGTSNDWYLLSSPVGTIYSSDLNTKAVNLKADDDSGVPQFDLYKYNEATIEWKNFNHSSFAMTQGLGFLYARHEGTTINFKGSLPVADVTPTLTYTADNGDMAGWNLLGNPFSHSITWDNIVATNVNTTGYYKLSNGGAWTADPSTTTPIKPMEGFLVKATAASPTLTMKNVAESSKGRANNDFLAFTVANSNYSDITYAMFSDGEGLEKINHRNTNVPMVYIPQDGERYAIATMGDETDMFNLNFKAMTTGKYTLSYKAEGSYDYLHVIDRITGEDVDMLIDGEYSFMASAGDNENRFIVKLRYNANGNFENDIFAYQNGDEIIVNGKGELQIFDVMGRFVTSMEVNGSERISAEQYSNAVYIFRLVGNDVKTQKIVVR